MDIVVLSLVAGVVVAGGIWMATRPTRKAVQGDDPGLMPQEQYEQLASAAKARGDKTFDDPTAEQLNQLRDACSAAAEAHEEGGQEKDAQ